VNPTQLKEPGTQDLEAFLRADFSPVAQVQSVWTDSPFLVEDLHQAERAQILQSFFEAPELQYHGPLEKPSNPLIAVFTGVAGAGKTQLLGQIRKVTVTATTRFLLADMTGVNKFQSTVCLHMVQSMLECGYARETQLQAVLARLCEISHSLGSEDAGWEYLNDAAAGDFDSLAESVLGGLRAQLQGPPGFLSVNGRKHVLRALMMLCLLPDERADAAFSWLQGVDLEQQDTERLRLPHVEPLDIVKSISWLTGFRGRTILAFDQLDVIVNQYDTASRGGDSETAAAAKAVILEITGGLAGLWEQLYRTQILVSCLEQTWSILKHNIMPGIMSRFVAEPVHLGEIPNTEIAERIVAPLFGTLTATSTHPIRPILFATISLNLVLLLALCYNDVLSINWSVSDAAKSARLDAAAMRSCPLRLRLQKTISLKNSSRFRRKQMSTLCYRIPTPLKKNWASSW
jgi:hypothetical protein